MKPIEASDILNLKIPEDEKLELLNLWLETETSRRILEVETGGEKMHWWDHLKFW